MKRRPRFRFLPRRGEMGSRYSPACGEGMGVTAGAQGHRRPWWVRGCLETYPGDADGAEPVTLGHLRHLGPVAVEVAAAVTAVTQQQMFVVVPAPAHQAGLWGAGLSRAGTGVPTTLGCQAPAGGSGPPTRWHGAAWALTTLLTDFSQAMDFSSW